MDHKKNKKLESKVVELISSEELISLFNLKAQIERRELRMKRRQDRRKHNGR